MKNYLLLLLGFSLLAKAQDKIVIEYDTAGNQTKRFLCLSSNCTITSKTKIPKELATLQEKDLQKFFLEDVISFYPNPIKEELYLKWELVPDKTVLSIYLYTMSGQILKTYNDFKKSNTLNIPFSEYPIGTYLVVLVYNDGEQKTIKIAK